MSTSPSTSTCLLSSDSPIRRAFVQKRIKAFSGLIGPTYSRNGLRGEFSNLRRHWADLELPKVGLDFAVGVGPTGRQLTQSGFDRLIESRCWNHAMHQANGEGFLRINALCCECKAA
jgi:hypothetical protein